MLRTCGSRPILTTNLTTNEVPLVSTAFGKTLEIGALAGTLVPAFYGSRRVRIPPTAPKREAKKDIGCKSPVFSRLPRPVDE